MNIIDNILIGYGPARGYPFNHDHLRPDAKDRKGSIAAGNVARYGDGNRKVISFSIDNRYYLVSLEGPFNAHQAWVLTQHRDRRGSWSWQYWRVIGKNWYARARSRRTAKILMLEQIATMIILLVKGEEYLSEWQEQWLERNERELAASKTFNAERIIAEDLAKRELESRSVVRDRTPEEEEEFQKDVEEVLHEFTKRDIQEVEVERGWLGRYSIDNIIKPNGE